MTLLVRTRVHTGKQNLPSQATSNANIPTDRFYVHLEDLAVTPDPHVYAVTVAQI